MSLRVLLFILLVFGGRPPGLTLVFGGRPPGLILVFGGRPPGLTLVFGGRPPGLTLIFGEFQVKVNQSLYEAQENSSVTMEWTFPPGAHLTQVDVSCDQSKDNTSRHLFVQVEGVEVRQLQDKHFGGRVRVDTDAQRRGLLQVHLRNLSREDSGLYSCSIMISGSGDAADCVLNVTSAPEPPRATEAPLSQDRTGLYIGLVLVLVLVLVNMTLT